MICMRYLIILVFSFIVQLSFGQASSLLWEISGKHLKKPSYLYGTMHVKDKRVFQFGDSVMIKFDQCSVFVGELNMDMDSKQLAEILKLSMMPKDTSLSMLLSKEDYDFVKKEGKKKLGNKALMFDKMKPMLSSALVTEELIQKDSSEFLDQYLRTQAKTKGMKTLGLETAQEQIAAIDKIPLKEQATILLNTLKDDKKTDQDLDKLFLCYLNQDMAGIEKYIIEYEAPEAFNKSVLTERNYVMASRIPKIIGKQPSFIAIGAAHLPGKEGVIELLKKKGYKVRPIISKFSAPQMPKDSATEVAGWVTYKANQLQISFPAEPKVNEESDQKISTVYALEPGTDNLYSLTFHSRIKNEQTAEQYFEEVLSGFSSSNSKIISKSKSTFKGFPSMDVEVMEGISTIRMKYYFLEDKIVELAITADKEEVKSKNSELFFNSFKISK